MSTNDGHRGTTRRYSNAFKRQVVESVEQEGYSQQQAADLYGCSQESVRRWIKKFGKNHLLNKVVRIQTMDEASRIDELKQQITKLKQALADAHMDRELTESRLEIACQKLDIDPEEFKKNMETSNNNEWKESTYDHKRTVPAGADLPAGLLSSTKPPQKATDQPSAGSAMGTHRAGQTPANGRPQALPPA